MSKLNYNHVFKFPRIFSLIIFLIYSHLEMFMAQHAYSVHNLSVASSWYNTESSVLWAGACLRGGGGLRGLEHPPWL